MAEIHATHCTLLRPRAFMFCSNISPASLTFVKQQQFELTGSSNCCCSDFDGDLPSLDDTANSMFGTVEPAARCTMYMLHEVLSDVKWSQFHRRNVRLSGFYIAVIAASDVSLRYIGVLCD